MFSKILTSVLVISAITVGGLATSKYVAAKSAKSCCGEGSACCVVSLPCCADPSSDCCYPGSPCCEAGAACCEK